MKIIFFGLEEAEESIFKGSLGEADLLFLKEKLNESNTEKAKDADVICVFVNSTVNKNVIDAIPGLKFIATRSTGYDHIDCEYAATKGIKIATVSGLRFSHGGRVYLWTYFESFQKYCKE